MCLKHKPVNQNACADQHHANRQYQEYQRHHRFQPHPHWIREQPLTAIDPIVHRHITRINRSSTERWYETRGPEYRTEFVSVMLGPSLGL